MGESFTADGYQVSSTTETSEQIQASFAALDGTPAEPVTESPADESPTEDPTPEPDKASEAAKTLNSHKSGLEKRKASIQAQIDELVAQRGQTQRERDEIKAELATLRAERDALKGQTAKPAPSTSPVPAEDDPEPQEDQFDTYRDFVKAQARWEARQEYREQDRKTREARQRDLATRAEQARLTSFTERLAKTREQHADFDARIDAGPALTKAMQEAILDADDPGAVMLYLADPDHQAEYQRIRDIGSPMGQYAAMKKLEGRVEAAAVRGPAPVAETKSQAPAPIKPLGSTPGAVVSDGPPNPDTCSQAEFDAYWNKQARSQR